MTDATKFPWSDDDDDERVVFETPELTPVEFRVAPFGSRIVAAMLDRMVIVGLTAGLFALAALLGALAGALDDDLALTGLAVLLVAQFLFSLTYFVHGDLRGEGQTWGKRLMGIRTVMNTGHGVTLGASLLRNLARVVDEIPLLWVVPSLVSGRRRAGDLLAGTLVVRVDRRAERLGEDDDGWRLAPSYSALENRQFYFSAEQGERLFPDDLNLLEHLAARLRRVPSYRQRRVLREVADRYIARLGLDAEADSIRATPRRFLQELTLFLEERFEGQAY